MNYTSVRLHLFCDWKINSALKKLVLNFFLNENQFKALVYV